MYIPISVLWPCPVKMALPSQDDLGDWPNAIRPETKALDIAPGLRRRHNYRVGRLNRGVLLQPTGATRGPQKCPQAPLLAISPVGAEPPRHARARDRPRHSATLQRCAPAQQPCRGLCPQSPPHRKDLRVLALRAPRLPSGSPVRRALARRSSCRARGCARHARLPAPLIKGRAARRGRVAHGALQSARPLVAPALALSQRRGIAPADVDVDAHVTRVHGRANEARADGATLVVGGPLATAPTKPLLPAGVRVPGGVRPCSVSQWCAR